MSDEVLKAMKVIKQAMIDDNPSETGSFAYDWHRMVAMMCADAIHDDFTEALTWQDAERIGNEAASKFMKLCFGVETK